MTWWSSYGGRVVAVAGMWLIFNDPIDRWLPVPMPALEPGPRTTWLGDAALLRNGSPDYAAAIDAEDAQRLEAGASGRLALERATSATANGTTLRAFLAGLAVRSSEPGGAGVSGRTLPLTGEVAQATPIDADRTREWSARCQAAVDQLLALPSDATLALPTSTSESNDDRPDMVRAPVDLLVLLHLASACLQQGRADLDRGDPAAALVQVGRLARLAALTAGIDDIPAHSAARDMIALGWKLALDAIASRPRDGELRRAAAAVLAATPPLPAADHGLGTLRLLALRFAIAIDRSFRSGRLSAEIRANSPPDVNEALRLLNDWFDQLERVFPRPLDGAGLATLGRILPLPAEVDQRSAADRKPLANRMLFTESVADRRRHEARFVVLAASGAAWMALDALANHARQELRNRRVLAAVVALPLDAEATACAGFLRQRLAADSGGEPLAVTIEGSAVMVAAIPAGQPRSPIIRFDPASHP